MSRTSCNCAMAFFNCNTVAVSTYNVPHKLLYLYLRTNTFICTLPVSVTCLGPLAGACLRYMANARGRVGGLVEASCG